MNKKVNFTQNKNMSNLKKYNIFITITSFAKLLVELFIPLILYDKGFTIKEIILFLILKYLFCALIIPITVKLGETFSYTKLMIASSIVFAITYIYLNFLSKNIISLFILAFIFSIYLVFYWLGRHIYALSKIEDKKTTDNVSLYSIFSILGGIPATYIGAIILKYFGYITLTILVLILMIISVIPLTKMQEVTFKEKTEVKKIITTFPKRNYAFLIIDNLRYIGNNIFPLFVYLYIKKKLDYLGIINIICGIGSIIYIYFLSKKMDKNKKDYLTFSIILLGIVYILKIVITNPKIFLIIIFFEGISKSALDAIVLRNTYAYGKNYDPVHYIAFIEFINNLARSIFFLIFYLFNFSLKSIIIISIIGIFTTSLIKFDDGKFGYKKNKLTN